MLFTVVGVGAAIDGCAGSTVQSVANSSVLGHRREQFAVLYYSEREVVNCHLKVHLHNGILCSSKKEGTLTFCDSMDGPGGYYAK